MLLGNSWTWCIGMFLPVLLIRDMGLWGWIVFAVPNVLGAALMGWVLKSPESSRRMVDSHGSACRAFSVITIAFHVFFILWFIPRLVGLPPAAIAFALAAIYLLLTFARPQIDLVVSPLVWILSIAMFVLFLRTPAAAIPSHSLLPAKDALYLAPVCILGFALCPYLDLTFHRARQSLPNPSQSRIAFGVGFGVVFLLMIVFSALYATALAPLLTPDWRSHLRPVFGKLIAAHMIVQATYTMALHGRSLTTSRITPAGVFGLIVVCQIALFVAIYSAIAPRFFSLDFGELIYRLFLSFYGLVFPAYVWIRMWPRQPSRLSATSIPAIVPILIAAPMYWLGFIQNRMLWLLPAVAIVLLFPYLAAHRQRPAI
jgi:hypothetical protein